VDKLERQAKRYREKRHNHHPHANSALVESAPVVAGEPEPALVKTKQFPVKPMTPEEAVLQLELIGPRLLRIPQQRGRRGRRRVSSPGRKLRIDRAATVKKPWEQHERCREAAPPAVETESASGGDSGEGEVERPAEPVPTAGMNLAGTSAEQGGLAFIGVPRLGGDWDLVITGEAPELTGADELGFVVVEDGDIYMDSHLPKATSLRSPRRSSFNLHRPIEPTASVRRPTSGRWRCARSSSAASRPRATSSS